jgi:O-methyltransferase
LYSNKIVGDYFEFGCHTARTFRFALKESIVRQMKMNFYAFDSFEGLPDHKNNEKQNSWHMPGLLSTSEMQFKKLVSKFSKYRKINTIKGFYEKTLDNNLKKKLKTNQVKASIINIDCDLEKSVSKSLDFALNFIVNGTILYIDDYYTTYKGDPRKGIPKIVKSLLKKNNIVYENWYQSSSCGRSFLLYK